MDAIFIPPVTRASDSVFTLSISFNTLSYKTIALEQFKSFNSEAIFSSAYVPLNILPGLENSKYISNSKYYFSVYCQRASLFFR